MDQSNFKVNLNNLQNILKYKGIEYEYNQEMKCIFIGLYDNLIYFYENRYELLDDENEDLIKICLNNIINQLPSNNIEFKHNS